MKAPLAHSPRPKQGIPPQLYRDHVTNVHSGATGRARRMLRFYFPAKEKPDAAELETIVSQASLVHDLGKLDPGMQNTLEHNRRSRNHIRHEDAGVLLLTGKANEAAGLVSAHHQGLIHYRKETTKERPGSTGQLDMNNFRIPDDATQAVTAARLADYISQHEQEIGPLTCSEETQHCALSGLTRRLLLSCLVDADHSDTSNHYGNGFHPVPPLPRWNERLEKLKGYVASLPRPSKNATPQEHERQHIRDELFRLCLEADPQENLRSCDAVVGSGKTTALMAHQLTVAAARGLRHIIVVLPYTNIIRQSVKTFRRALCLEGENPEQIVAEHHHQAEFGNPDIRHLTTQWQAPIIVTTAVQFFETLASNIPARLRKLHELPGSTVCLDEAHAALPSKLWPICWKWLIEWTRRWSGHLILASGSLPEFWKMPEFRSICDGLTTGKPPKTEYFVSSLCANIRAASEEAEDNRVRFDSAGDPMTGEELMTRIESAPGPRIVVLNTVQATAVLASRLRDRGNNTHVLHLSTALTPVHRAVIIDRIRSLLKHQQNWTLVATSLVEAGMDFSFASGFRQQSTAASLIQLGGRVNRAADKGVCTVLDFDLSDREIYPDNPYLETSKAVLRQLFENGQLGRSSSSPLVDVCNAALRAEFNSKEQKHALQLVQEEWQNSNYPEIGKKCRVIEGETKTVVIDPGVLKRLQRFEKVTHLDLIRNSIQMYPYRIEKLCLEDAVRSQKESGLYCLPGSWSYDPDFLGYMEGMLPQLDARIPSGYFI